MTETELALNHTMGERLRTARNARGLSLSELAALTKGQLSKSRISNYEQGLRRMRVEAAVTLAKALENVSAAHLLCVDDEGTGIRGPSEARLLQAYRRAGAEARRAAMSQLRGDATAGD